MFVNTAMIFRKAAYKLSGINNNNDLFVYPVPDSAIYTFRNNFQLHIDEIVLYARDTSFWNNKNQGTVVTDWGVRFIPDNDSINQIYQISWRDILYVEYSGETLHFFSDENRNNHLDIHINNFLKEPSQLYAKDLAKIFTKLAKSQNVDDLINEVKEKYERLINEGQINEALSVILRYREDEDDVYFSPYIAKIYHEKGQSEKAISILTEDCEKLSDNNDLYWRNVLNFFKYDIYNKLGDKVNARRFCLEVKQNSKQDDEFDNINIQNVSYHDFEIIEKHFVQHFLEYPYEKRKLIVPVELYSDLSQVAFTVLNIKNLPAINFPVGHPVANQLYVGHPYLPSKYIPFENYELELLEDKIREFCLVMQYLGAIEINIDCQKSLSSNKGNAKKQIFNLDIDYKLFSGNSEYKRSRNSKLLNDISKSISLHQRFNPRSTPCLPPNLVWYPNEPSWQRIYDQRMQGKFDFNIHEERIETRKNQVIDNSEFRQISLEIKNLIIRANGSWEQSMEEKFEEHENSVLSIRVKFAPLNKLGKESYKKEFVKEIKCKKDSLNNVIVNVKETIKCKVENVFRINNKLSSKEEEYLTEMKACLDENNEISLNERNFLNRIRVRLGISEKRALELEASLFQPILSKNEIEYFDEYKMCMAKEGEITLRARRMLDRFRNKLGISEERASEIEKMY